MQRYTLIVDSEANLDPNGDVTAAWTNAVVQQILAGQFSVVAVDGAPPALSLETRLRQWVLAHRPGHWEQYELGERSALGQIQYLDRWAAPGDREAGTLKYELAMTWAEHAKQRGRP